MDFEENLSERSLVVSPPTTAIDENDPRAFDCLKFIKPLENDDFREKCGEIFVENGKYTLMCKFCQEDHENLEIFIEHMVEHLIPKIEELDSDVSSDCKSDEEIDNEVNERDYKDKIPLISNFKFARPNNFNFENSKKFYFQRIKNNSNFNNFDINNRSIPTHHQFFGNKLNRNPNEYKSATIEIKNEQQDGNDGNDGNNDINNGNTIECVPDLGMFYDFENPAENGNETNNEKLNQNTENNWNGHTVKNISPYDHNWNKASDGRFYCHMCDKSYQYSKSLKEHVDLVHKYSEKLFKCPTCDKAFTKQWKLNTHLKVHTDERPYICNICVMTFKWKKNLSRHLIRVHNVRLSDIKPEDYNLNLLNNKVEDRYLNEEDNTQTFNEQLFKGNRGVNTINDFPIIKNLLTDNSLNSNQSRTTPDDETLHFLKHSIKTEKPDEDEDENSQFISDPLISLRDPPPLAQLKSMSTGNFNRRMSQKSSRGEFFNPGLPRIKTEPQPDHEYNQNDDRNNIDFFKLNSRNQQRSNNPSEQSRNQPSTKAPSAPLVPNKDGFYSCRTCSKVYLRKDSLRAHERIHSAGLNCEFCGKSFSHRYFLERHVRTHTGEKPFRCHLCNASFVEENSLRNHIKFHIGDKRFACQFCSKRFIKQYEKIEHERNAHNNQIPPYKCDFCSKYFQHIKNLRYHKKICQMNPEANKCDTGSSSQLYTILNKNKELDKNMPEHEQQNVTNMNSEPKKDTDILRKDNCDKEENVQEKQELNTKETEKKLKRSNPSAEEEVLNQPKAKQNILLQPRPIEQLQNMLPNRDSISRQEYEQHRKEELPRISMQEHLRIPKQEHPRISQQEHPRISQQEHPRMSQQEHPRMSQQEHPRISQQEHPRISQQEHPRISQQEHPRIPKQEHPRIPKQEHPRMPKQEHPRMPKQEHPRIPKLEHPKLHDEQDQVLLPPNPYEQMHDIRNENNTPHRMQHHQQQEQAHHLLLPQESQQSIHESQLQSSLSQHSQLHQQHQQHQQHLHHPSSQYSAQQHLHHNHHPHHQYQLSHSLGQTPEQLQVEQSYQQHQLQQHYHNFQHQYSQHHAAHLQPPTPQLQLQQYHPQQFNFQSHSQYLAAATHPQAYYPQQYQMQQHPAAHLHHPQQYEPQSHLANQIAYVHDSFS